jgi:hypothetical protein
MSPPRPEVFCHRCQESHGVSQEEAKAITDYEMHALRSEAGKKRQSMITPEERLRINRKAGESRKAKGVVKKVKVS